MTTTPFRHLLALLLLAASLSAASALECGSSQVFGRTDYDAFGVLIDRTGSTDNSFLYPLDAQLLAFRLPMTILRE